MGNLVLIGMPACGKSTIGVVLAKTLGKAFLDTDLLIQKREGDLLQNLIDKKGMDKFLKMEEEALLSIDVNNTVIATGGSVVYSDKGMKKLSELGTIVYIELPLETIVKRINNIHSRGIAMGKGETLADLYKKRVPLYEKYADITIKAEGLSVEGVIDQIISKIA
ncbi:MAG: shikimate kinase [Clostridiales bacterium]|nr:shikimate kinase [Clostridiales bacterium]